MSIITSIKTASATIKLLPTLIIIAAIVLLGWFLNWTIGSQKKEINDLRITIGVLQDQNGVILQSNEALAQDMKSIKEGMETFNTNILIINKENKELTANLNSKDYRVLVVEDTKKAEELLNTTVNQYFRDINEETAKYEK